MLSTDFLQALLSPDGRIRDQAETVFRSISVPERVQALTNLLMSMVNNNNTNNGVSMLASVLLRRDILKLTDPSMLNELVTPLLHCYMNTSTNTKVAVGHCLAEICSSLSVIGGGASSLTSTSTVDPVLSKIVSTVIDPQQQQGMDNSELLVSLKLLAALADRAPIGFTRVAIPSLPGLVTSCIQSNAVAGTNANANAILFGKLVEVVVNGAVATTVTDISLTSPSAPTTKNLDELVIDETSPAAQIGSQCLLPLLKELGPIGRSIPLEVLQALSHAAVTCPSLLLGSCGQVLQTVLQMCLNLSATVGNNNDNDGDNTIALASLQVLSSLFSVGDVRHRILSADMAQELAERVVPVCAQVMAQKCDDEDDEDVWVSEPPTLAEDTLDDGESNDEAIFATTLMENFLLYLSGPALGVALPLVRQLLPLDEAGNNINNNDWRHVRAGLAILEVGLVAAPVALGTHVPEIVQTASSLADVSSHPRVQYQAIRLLGVICETHSSVRKVYGQIILERVAAALSSSVSKISALASLVISSYCRGDGNNSNDEDEEEITQQCLVPFLPDLLKALIEGPLSIADTGPGSVVVRVRAMNAVACVGGGSGQFFCPYYAHVMPGLLASVQITQVDIATAALQSLTIVGQAVGKDMFQSDAKQVLSWVISALPTATAFTSAETSSSSSFSTSDLLSASARIAAVLEEDFLPYVDAVLPALYHIAKAPADISIEEGNETGMQDDHATDENTMTVAIPGRGFQRISINTCAILEKATNNRIMFELIKALGFTFGRRVKEAFDIFLPLAKFLYSADVRSTSAQTLSALFDSACAYGEKVDDMSIPRHYLPLLSDAISEQIAKEDPSDTEALYVLGDSLSEIYYIAYRYRNGNEILKHFSIEMRGEVVKRCMKTMVDCLGRRAGITNILQGNLTGVDEKDDYTAQLRAEDSLLTPLVDSIGYLLKFSKARFVPIFESCIVPVLGKYLTSTSDVRASVAAVCLFDDVAEHCGPEAAHKFSPNLLQGIMVVMKDPSKYEKDLVQAAIYGIAQITRHCPSNIISSNDMQTIVHQLLILTQAKKEDIGDDIYLYEIATSALASLVLFGPFADLKFVNRNVVIDIFLKSLPLEQDEDEAKICHAGLCSLIENGSIDLKVEATRIISVIGSILSDVKEGVDIAEGDTCERFVKILYEMQCQNPLGMEQTFAGLDPSVRNVVGSVVHDFAQSCSSSVVTP